jgi:hypothetical protein
MRLQSSAVMLTQTFSVVVVPGRTHRQGVHGILHAAQAGANTVIDQSGQANRCTTWPCRPSIITRTIPYMRPYHACPVALVQ